MLQPLLHCLRQLLPLTIAFVKWEDPLLSLQGPDWDFHTTSAWRVISDTIVVYACWDNDVSHKLQGLMNQEIIGVEVQSSMIEVDPVFILSHGQRLEIFSTETFEPWVMHLPSGEVFVASPSDQEAFAPYQTRNRGQTGIF